MDDISIQIVTNVSMDEVIVKTIHFKLPYLPETRKTIISQHEEACSICLEEYKIGSEQLQLTTCKHVFHNFCVRTWVKQNLHNGSLKAACPLCKTAIKVMGDY